MERTAVLTMARWTRAAKLLALPPGARVLDLGCAFGFGTRFLTHRYETFGHDLSEAYIRRARQSLPSATFTCGPAHDVPYPDDFFDGLVVLDVLEHVPDERAVILEIARVLRPGGRLVLSVPNQGLLAWFDSLNLYRVLFGSRRPAPTDDPSWPVSPIHRHYSIRNLEFLFTPAFKIRNVRYTGLGLAEAINLVLLVFFKALAPSPRVYERTQYLYFGAYLLEDLVRTPSWGYHMMLAAERA